MRKTYKNMDTINKLSLKDLMDRDLYMLFYKGDYAFYSVLIKWWTRSKYSHVEFYLTAKKTEADPDGLNEKGKFIGISGEQNVRIIQYDSEKPLKVNPKWDYVKIPDEMKVLFMESLEKVYNRTRGKKYDWLGILTSHIFGRKIGDPNKYTCSEWITEVIDEAMGIIYPKWYSIFSPEDVYRVVQDKIIKK